MTKVTVDSKNLSNFESAKDELRHKLEVSELAETAWRNVSARLERENQNMKELLLEWLNVATPEELVDFKAKTRKLLKGGE